MRQSRAAPSRDPDLRSPEAWRRIAAIRRVTASGVDDPEVEAALLDALDDPGAHQYQERDWGNVADERAMQTVVVRVAEVAVAALGSPRRRERTVACLEARIASRTPDAAAPLFAALGALAPEATDVLLRALGHPDVSARRAAVNALGRAVCFSQPRQKLAVLRRAVEGLSDCALRDAWLALLAHTHALLAAPGQDGTRAAVRSDGPDVDTLARWLASDVRAVREVASSMLACRTDDARARDLLAELVAADLPRAAVAPVARDANGFRRSTEAELAVHILAHEQTLTVACGEHGAARDALREYALQNLRAPEEPWLVALAVARQLTDEPQIADVVLDRLEAPDPNPELGPLPGLLVVHARAAGPRRAEIVRRGALALLSPQHTAREGGALRALAAVDGEAFTAAVLPLLARAQPYDREAWLIAEGLEGAGPAGVTALPTLEALASRMIGWSPIKRAIKTLGRVRASG